MPEGDVMFPDTPLLAYTGSIRPGGNRVLSPPPLHGKRYARAPVLVEWEATRACSLACRPCRAQPITERHGGELTTEEARRLVDQVRGFSTPPPSLLISGGDPLERPDLAELVAYAAGRGLSVTVQLCPTARLTRAAVDALAGAGARAVSLGLDGPDAAAHDGERGEPGSFARTVAAADWVRGAGLNLRILTRVTEKTMIGLEALARVVAELGAAEWALEFPVGAPGGPSQGAINPWQYGVVLQWLDELSQKAAFSVVAVNGPQLNRLAFQRLRAQGVALTRIQRSAAGRRFGVREGRGMLFVSRTGDVYPSRHLRLPVGNVRARPLHHIYRRGQLFAVLRDEGRLRGKCGLCQYRALCGGSRARAYSLTGDPLGSDPWGLYTPWRDG
ncbi:MAG: radical SAM protein [Limnochordales bacterium]